MKKFFLSFGAERFAAFVIDADDLLVTGDDAGFYGGDAFGIGENALARDVNSVETGDEGAAGFVAAYYAEGFDLRAESGDVGGDVACATEAFGLGDEVDDGDGGFWREARGGAPEIAVEHEVAEDADAFAAEAGDEAF